MSARRFKLATAGWMLGPQHDRAAFDADLPKRHCHERPARGTRHRRRGPGVRPNRRAARSGRFPWLESDVYQGLAGVQLLAGRMRRDAADAAAYGCTGLMGLQWRTDILAPNISALAQAAWDQSWKPAPATTWQMAGAHRRLPQRENHGCRRRSPLSILPIRPQNHQSQGAQRPVQGDAQVLRTALQCAAPSGSSTCSCRAGRWSKTSTFSPRWASSPPWTSPSTRWRQATGC